MLQNFQSKKILIAPLDWGLGHATRCIPIVNEILKYSKNITIAATSNCKLILQEAFPSLSFIEIPNYNITYGKNKFFTIVKLFLQINKIKSKIKEENKWLENILQNSSFDILISDNRYGLYNKKTNCIFITHQLQPLPLITNFGKRILQKIIYKYINRFNQCWVMDGKGNNALAGKLSNPTNLPKIKTKYIGIVTRLQKQENENKKFDVAIILSGPEPQRTIFENIIFKQLQIFKTKAIIIRGTNNTITHLNLPTNSTIINIANTIQLQNVIAESKYIICRSGYTSLMDYLSIGANCIVVPTPGQSEQNYLAKNGSQKNYFITANQNKFKLEILLKKAQQFNFKKIEANENLLEQTVKNLFTT